MNSPSSRPDPNCIYIKAEIMNEKRTDFNINAAQSSAALGKAAPSSAGKNKWSLRDWLRALDQGEMDQDETQFSGREYDDAQSQGDIAQDELIRGATFEQWRHTHSSARPAFKEKAPDSTSMEGKNAPISQGAFEKLSKSMASGIHGHIAPPFIVGQPLIDVLVKQMRFVEKKQAELKAKESSLLIQKAKVEERLWMRIEAETLARMDVLKSRIDDPNTTQAKQLEATYLLGKEEYRLNDRRNNANATRPALGTMRLEAILARRKILKSFYDQLQTAIKAREEQLKNSPPDEADIRQLHRLQSLRDLSAVEDIHLLLQQERFNLTNRLSNRRLSEQDRRETQKQLQLSSKTITVIESWTLQQESLWTRFEQVADRTTRIEQLREIANAQSPEDEWLEQERTILKIEGRLLSTRMNHLLQDALSRQITYQLHDPRLTNIAKQSLSQQSMHLEAQLNWLDDETSHNFVVYEKALETIIEKELGEEYNSPSPNEVLSRELTMRLAQWKLCKRDIDHQRLNTLGAERQALKKSAELLDKSTAIFQKTLKQIAMVEALDHQINNQAQEQENSRLMKLERDEIRSQLMLQKINHSLDWLDDNLFGRHLPILRGSNLTNRISQLRYLLIHGDLAAETQRQYQAELPLRQRTHALETELERWNTAINELRRFRAMDERLTTSATSVEIDAAIKALNNHQYDLQISLQEIWRRLHPARREAQTTRNRGYTVIVSQLVDRLKNAENHLEKLIETFADEECFNEQAEKLQYFMKASFERLDNFSRENNEILASFSGHSSDIQSFRALWNSVDERTQLLEQQLANESSPSFSEGSVEEAPKKNSPRDTLYSAFTVAALENAVKILERALELRLRLRRHIQKTTDLNRTRTSLAVTPPIQNFHGRFGGGA
jgi:hypothetical protein